MRTVHVGNVANIAYLTAKALRAQKGEADVYIPERGLHALSYPEWEEGDFDVTAVSVSTPDWTRVEMRNGWKRPAWVKPVPEPMWQHLPHAEEDPFVAQCERRLNVRRAWRQHRVVNAGLRRRGLAELSLPDTNRMFDIYRWDKMVRYYDIVVAYGAEPINCLLDYPQKPFIAVDYGSPLRTMIFGDSGPFDPRLLRASYERADRVVLTNPDTQPIAEDLRLRYVFIPHPVDEAKFRPGPSPLREEIERQFGRESVVVFCPTRHDWKVKGSDVMIRGVARVLRGTRARVVLVLAAWGEDVEKSRDLLRREGIVDQVVWQPALPKIRIADWYRAADVILDQFVIGTFGLVTAEAMACGKPVILSFKPEVHRWCFAELPPVVPAADEGEVFRELLALVEDRDRREALGQSAREWFLRYHSLEIVARAHVRLYREVLPSGAGGEGCPA